MEKEKEKEKETAIENEKMNVGNWEKSVLIFD